MMLDIRSAPALERCVLAGSLLKRFVLYSTGLLALDNARLVVVVGLLIVHPTVLRSAASLLEEKRRRRLRKVEVDEEEEVLFLWI